MKLKDKVIVVTGGNSGIGRASAEKFAREGAKVVIFGRNEDTVQATVASLGDGSLGVQGDVTSTTDLERLINTVKTEHGRIDGLFINAGIAEFLPLEAADPDHFDRLINVNFKGAYFTLQKALPLLNEGASVLLNTSITNVKGFPNTSVYSATKAALRSLARTLAAELADRNIRVNAISPGPVSTPIYDRLGMAQEDLDEFASGIQTQIPLGRFGAASELANSAAFLLSDEASFITGTELSVDGGIAQV